MFRKFVYGLFYFFVIAVSLHTALFFVTDGLGSPIAEKLFQSPVAPYLHLYFAAIALAIGALQVSQRLRARHLCVHKILGRVYVFAVIVSAYAGLFMAMKSDGGIMGNIGIGSLSVIWGVTVCMAYIRIRQGNVVAHRYWMIINYALTCAGITLRLQTGLIFGVLQLEMQTGFAILYWSSWVPNLLIALMYLAKTNTKDHINPTKAVEPLRV